MTSTASKPAFCSRCATHSAARPTSSACSDKLDMLGMRKKSHNSFRYCSLRSSIKFCQLVIFAPSLAGKYPISCLSTVRVNQLLQCYGSIHLAGTCIVLRPTRGYGFSLGVELNHLLAIRSQVTQFRPSRSGETEKWQRHRDRQINADLADIDFVLKFSGGSAA